MKLLMAMAIFLIACGTSLEEKRQTGSYSTKSNDICTSHSDCGPLRGCLVQAGVCLDYLNENQVFTIAVDPGSGSDLIPDQFPSFPVGNNGQLNLTLTEPLVVRGVVAFGVDPAMFTPETAGNSYLSGRLIATAPGYIPGTYFRSQADVSATANTSADGPWTFEIRVVPGLPWPYDVVFLPDPNIADPDLRKLPPFRTQVQFTSERHDIFLPARGEYMKVSGRVVFNGHIGVAGARVIASGQSDYATLGVSSTTAITDETGSFSMILLARSRVVLRAEPGDSSSVFRPKEFEISPPLGSERFEMNDASGLLLDLGEQPELRSISVQVLNSSMNEPIANAIVQVTSDDGLSITGVTDGTGIVKLVVVDGTYRVAVMPPQESIYAARIADMEVTPESSPSFLLLLDRRAVICGRVIRQSTGQGVEGAVVTFSTNRLPSFGNVSLGLQDISFTTLTDMNGEFKVSVDPGRYALVVVPPIESGLPRYSQPVVDLSSGDSSMTIPVPEGALIYGKVTRATTKSGKFEPVPVSNVQLKFYYYTPKGASVADMWAGAEEPTFAASVQIASTARTLADGTYTAIVPVLLNNNDGNMYGGNEETPATGFGLPSTEVNPL